MAVLKSARLLMTGLDIGLLARPPEANAALKEERRLTTKLEDYLIIQAALADKQFSSIAHCRYCKAIVFISM